MYVIRTSASRPFRSANQVPARVDDTSCTHGSGTHWVCTIHVATTGQSFTMDATVSSDGHVSLAQ
jgi:hypothetical protein